MSEPRTIHVITCSEHGLVDMNESESIASTLRNKHAANHSIYVKPKANVSLCTYELVKAR